MVSMIYMLCVAFAAHVVHVRAIPSALMRRKAHAMLVQSNGDVDELGDSDKFPKQPGMALMRTNWRSNSVLNSSRSEALESLPEQGPGSLYEATMREDAAGGQDTRALLSRRASDLPASLKNLDAILRESCWSEPWLEQLSKCTNAYDVCLVDRYIQAGCSSSYSSNVSPSECLTQAAHATACGIEIDHRRRRGWAPAGQPPNTPYSRRRRGAEYRRRRNGKLPPSHTIICEAMNTCPSARRRLTCATDEGRRRRGTTAPCRRRGAQSLLDLQNASSIGSVMSPQEPDRSSSLIEGTALNSSGGATLMRSKASTLPLDETWARSLQRGDRKVSSTSEEQHGIALMRGRQQAKSQTGKRPESDPQATALQHSVWSSSESTAHDKQLDESLVGKEMC